MDKNLSESFKSTISLDSLGEMAKETAEVTLDSLLSEGVLKEFPIIGSLLGVWKTGIAIRDYRFINKLLSFLAESSKLSVEKRQQIIEQLEEEEYHSEAGEKILAILDQLETKSKAKMLGKCLVLFGNKEISKEEFWRVAYIIEKLPMTDILALKYWKITDINRIEDIRRHLYLSVGLGWFVMNISSTGFCWQERLCEIFEGKLID